MTKTLDVTGIGHALVDIIAPCKDELLARFNLDKGIMRLTSDTEAAALYAEMPLAVETSGGSAANTCAGIASFGGRVGFIGKLGQDKFADVFTCDMNSIGVTFQPQAADANAATGTCLILVTPDGERTMNTNLGAAALFSDTDIDVNAIESTRIVYLEGYLFDPIPARAAFKTAAALARRAETQVAFTLSDPFCVDRYREAFIDFIASDVDIVFANEKELLSLYPGASFEQACKQIGCICRIAAITRSEKGSTVISNDHTICVEAIPIEQVADATGAGDLYAAGFLYGLSQNFSLERCGKLGSLAATEAISHIGPRPQLSLNNHAQLKGLI